MSKAHVSVPAEGARSVRTSTDRRERPRRPSFPEPDARTIRTRFGVTQTEFARLLGISVGTLRNWEQGIRRPAGAARVLLHVVERHPEAVRDACALATTRSLPRPPKERR